MRSPARAAPLLALRTRRVSALVTVIFLIAALTGAATFSDYGLMDSGEALTPIARLLPAVAACVIAAGIRLTTPGLEAMASTRLTVGVSILLPALTTLTIVALLSAHSLSAGIQHVRVPSTIVWHVVAAVLGWVSLGVLSSVLLGDRYAFVLPALSVAAMTLFGYDATANARVWNIAGLHESRGTVLVAAGLYLGVSGLWVFLRYRSPLPLLGSGSNTEAS